MRCWQLCGYALAVLVGGTHIRSSIVWLIPETVIFITRHDMYYLHCLTLNLLDALLEVHKRSRALYGHAR